MIKKSIFFLLGSAILLSFSISISNIAAYAQAPNRSTWISDTNTRNEITSYTFDFTTQDSMQILQNDTPYIDIQFPEEFNFEGVELNNHVSINIGGTDYDTNQIDPLGNGIRIYVCEDTQDPCVLGSGGSLELPANLHYTISIENMQNPTNIGTYSRPLDAITLGTENEGLSQVNESIVPTPAVEIVKLPIVAYSEWESESELTNAKSYYAFYFNTQEDILLFQDDIPYIDIQFPAGFNLDGIELNNDIGIDINENYYSYQIGRTIPNGIRIYLCNDSQNPSPCINENGDGSLELPAGLDYSISIDNIVNPSSSGTYSRSPSAITVGSEGISGSQVSEYILLSPDIEIFGVPIPPSVEIKKTANQTQVISGDIIHYTINLNNPTDLTLGVMMADLPMPYFGMDLDGFSGSMDDFANIFGDNPPISSSGVVFIGLVLPAGLQILDEPSMDEEGCAIVDEGGIHGLMCQVILSGGESVDISYDVIIDYSLYNYGDIIYNLSYAVVGGIIEDGQNPQGGAVGAEFVLTDGISGGGGGGNGVVNTILTGNNGLGNTTTVLAGVGGGTRAVGGLGTGGVLYTGNQGGIGVGGGTRGGSGNGATKINSIEDFVVKMSDVNVEYVQNRTIISGGGGGGYVREKDNCPDGDNSGDRYDGSCKKSTIPVQENPEDKDKLISPLSVNELIFNPLLKTCKIPLYIPTYYQDNYVSIDFRIAHQMLYSYDLTTWKGTQDYKPYENLTREQASKLMVNFAKNILCRQKTRQYNNNFSDIKDANTTLTSYTTEAYEYGIFNGNSDGTFKPTDIITRDELSATLVRLVTDSFLEEPRLDWAIYYRDTLKGFTRDVPGNSVQRGNVAELLYDLYKNNTYQRSLHGYIITQ